MVKKFGNTGAASASSEEHDTLNGACDKYKNRNLVIKCALEPNKCYWR